MGRHKRCQYRGCVRLIDPKDKWGREFGLCPGHAREAEITLGIKPGTVSKRKRRENDGFTYYHD